jgi:hypothetical protein
MSGGIPAPITRLCLERLTMAPWVSLPGGFPFLFFTFPIFLLNIILPTFSNVARRV